MNVIQREPVALATVLASLLVVLYGMFQNMDAQDIVILVAIFGGGGVAMRHFVTPTADPQTSDGRRLEPVNTRQTGV